MQLMSTQVFIAYVFLMIFGMSAHAQFSQPKVNINQDLSVTLTQKNEYIINQKILVLLTLSTTQPDRAEMILMNSAFSFNHLNAGEQYLLLLLKANIAQYNENHQQVIALLEQAQLRQSNIADKQLTSPLFANLYQVLATSLAATQNYEKAYQVKKIFVDEYDDYGDAERERIVKQLTKKYEIKHKIETNKLLDNQNKLKAIHLDDVERKQAIQQRNIILILCSLVIILLLFFRQLKVRQKLILLTKTDSLTGLINRSSLFVKGQELLKISTEQRLELSTLLFSIDGFKKINEKLGRHHGDLVLAKVAELVSETMRARDVFARLNGEEFVAILPSTDIDKAKAIAMRVIEKVLLYDFKDLSLEKNITLSIGVVSQHDTKAVFDDLLHAADIAMQQASDAGGNQMVRYSAIIKV
jgi:diguanylate cyclase (GGDEF)-like protein